MERGHEFTIELPGEGTYVVKLLEGVQIEKTDDTTTVGHWPAFDLKAKGDSEGEVYQKLVDALRDQTGAPGSSEFEPLEAYVREYGMRMSDEDVAARELARVREISVRWRATDDEQYMVKLFQDVEVRRDSDSVTLHAFGLEGSGQHLRQALMALKGAISEAWGEHDAPGPRFDEFASWARLNGERVPGDVLAQEAKDKQAYEVARNKLTAITPDDIIAESSTGVPLLIDFWAEWCGPCRSVTPVLAELAERWAGRIVIRKIEVDQFEGIWERFNFRGIPAMLVFKGGQVVEQIVGLTPKEELKKVLDKHI